MIELFATLEVIRPQADIIQITLARPAVRNALSSEMMSDLYRLWSSLYVRSKGIRCAILTGKGDKAFCAGADLKERNAMDVETWQEQHAVLEQAMVAMLDCPVPIIAAVNGAAFGGGLELALACDFAYASDNATFAFPETKIGIMPGAMGTQRLPQACGIRKAKELCFTGATLTAAQALHWGIVNAVCTPSRLMEEVLSIASTIARNAPLAVRQVKKALDVAGQQEIRSGYRYEIEAYNKLIPTQDRQEGIRAFNEKRPPVFTGN